MGATKSLVVGVSLGLALVAACRSSNHANPDGPVDPGGDVGDGRIHIQDVQSDAMAPNTPVDLHGVIVTAVDTYSGTSGAMGKVGDLWVEESGGGPFSGVHVFGTPLTQVMNLAPGDIVDITGAIKTEFALTSDTSGRTTTELQAPKGGMLTVTKTGTGTVPAPHILDASALDAMTQTARDAEYEKWEGVLIQLQNVRTQSYPQGFGSKPYPDDAYKVNVSNTLILESTQVHFPAIDGLTCFSSITGVEDYFFDWLILPRSAGDMVSGNGCAAVAPTTQTISQVQAAPPTGIVEIDGVYVTGVSNGKTSFWISTSPTAAQNEGGYVFQSSTTLTLDPAIVSGVKVDVIGKVTEFNDDTLGGALTEISPLRITVRDTTAATLTPITGLAASSLLDAATAPTYESVLVTLDNVAITAIGTSANGFIATGKQAGTSFGLGTDILHLAAADMACYTSITGFWTNLEAAGVTTKPNAFGFIPLTLTGKGTGTCN